jgi:hypothetical protein
MTDTKPLKEIISRAVKGESSPWPIDPDPAYKAEGSFEDRYNAGDKQILLWAIDDCAQRGEPVPEWAAEALSDILYRMATGEFATWDDAFGKIFANGYRQGGMRTLSRMFDVWFRVKQLSGEGQPIGDGLYDRVGRELGVGGKTTVANLYREVERDLHGVFATMKANAKFDAK